MDNNIYNLKTNCNLAVKNVRFYNGNSYFTIVDDITEVHGCTVKDSSDGYQFVSFPAYKGTDGKWYKHAYIDLNDDETDEIIDIIASLASESQADDVQDTGRRGGSRGRNNRDNNRRDKRTEEPPKKEEPVKKEEPKGGRRRNGK